MTKCVYCLMKSNEPEGYNRNFCDSCVKDKEIGVPHFKQTVFVKTYGNAEKVEIDEIRRYRQLPYKRSDGYSYPGRLNDNGKIQEVELKR